MRQIMVTDEEYKVLQFALKDVGFHTEQCGQYMRILNQMRRREFVRIDMKLKEESGFPEEYATQTGARYDELYLKYMEKLGERAEWIKSDLLSYDSALDDISDLSGEIREEENLPDNIDEGFDLAWSIAYNLVYEGRS